MSQTVIENYNKVIKEFGDAISNGKELLKEQRTKREVPEQTKAFWNTFDNVVNTFSSQVSFK